MIGEHLAQDRDRAHVVRIGHRMVEIPGAAEVLHQALADGVGVVSMRMAEVIACPGLGLGRQLGVVRVKERPGVMGKAVH